MTTNDTELVEVVARAIRIANKSPEALKNPDDALMIAAWKLVAEAAIAAARPIIEREVLEDLMGTGITREMAVAGQKVLNEWFEPDVLDAMRAVLRAYAKSRNITLGERE